MELEREACYRAVLTRDVRFDGRFFTAVKTTGIYCRPICPARPPKLVNCLFFPSAVAAQAAGFRPCLRCRPEISPDLPAWNGTSNTVSRAFHLIDNAAAGDQDLGLLAERLGIGDRHLRHLFQEHVGIAPKSVMQTRRILFAKQLITDTSMSLADIALASGFNSIRTFNHTMRQLYGRAPREFRRRRVVSENSAVRLLLPYSPPYDWPALLGFLRQRVIPGIEAVTADRYARTIELNGQYGFVSVRQLENANSLEAAIQFPDVRALPEIVRRLRGLFDLTAHPATISEHLATDPILASATQQRPGLRIPGAWDGFEMAVRAVLGQQISVRAATQLAGALAAAHGKPLSESVDSALRLVFPTPAVIAESDLACLRMPESRKKTIQTLAASLAKDPLILQPSQMLDESIDRLRSLPGIGEWTAQYVAMRVLRQPDAFPAQDVGLLRAFAQRGIKLTPRELLKRAESWRPWRAYAAMYLWISDRGTSGVTNESLS
jgi:AraC family transcriptional regulator, regulatory protein of adaptative response / DNA-3-methyladenine glycosylase II